MKSIFDETTRVELINRIHSLNGNSAAQWGKMNVSQMVKHCIQWDEMAFGKTKYKQIFLGKLFGKMALRDMLQDKQIKKNLSTVPSFKIKEYPDFLKEKDKWLQSLEGYKYFSNEGFIHPFFGPMTKEHTGFIVYKHIDHHLRQFNC
jgi:hypothetical protein